MARARPGRPPEHEGLGLQVDPRLGIRQRLHITSPVDRIKHERLLVRVPTHGELIALVLVVVDCDLVSQGHFLRDADHRQKTVAPSGDRG